MGFRSLRVINDDRVAPGKGFGMHPHRDMEILTYVLEGALEHRDSMGNGSVVSAGEVQRMTAGTGIMHSEYNASGTEGVHLLQIWILPEAKGLTPGYEQTAVPADLSGALHTIAARHGGNGAARIHQDAEVAVGRMSAGDRLDIPIKPGRYAWLQMARGAVSLNGVALTEGDGAAVQEEAVVTVEARTPAEFLWFDLA
jgi:redox-sensitive bicupin YhaK (pirin superfamily)